MELMDSKIQTKKDYQKEKKVLEYVIDETFIIVESEFVCL